MARKTAAQRRRRIASERGIALSTYDYNYICKRHPGRVGIIAEGDSWFSYPRKWIAFGADTNILHHVCSKLERSNASNILRLASNGDEAVEMTSGRQFRKLANTLERSGEQTKLLLFSAGGNDIVGKFDLNPMLVDYVDGMSAVDCIDGARLERKLDAIELSFVRLIELCADTAPHLQIVSHTYDIAKPWDQGAEFFWGLIKTKPWVYPYLVERGIPRALHLPIIEILLQEFRARLLRLSSAPTYRTRFHVVDTQGTLRPGSKVDWLNEIHPTSKGFEKISRKVYRKMRELEPSLPR